MRTHKRSEFFKHLVVLSLHYPEMRFGQLACFACSLAGDEEPGELEATSDQAVVGAIKSHLTRRFGGKGTELRNIPAALSNERGELIDLLAAQGDLYPDWPTGKLLNRLAALAHMNLYDAEDSALLQAAQSRTPGLEWFAMYMQKLKANSVIELRHIHPNYRCPCCTYRTLHERGGFEICPVCYWEDDGQDDQDADTVRGGPNGTLSLSKARESFSQLGICDSVFKEHVRLPRPEEL